MKTTETQSRHSVRRTGSGLESIGSIGRFKPLKPGKIHLRCARCKNTRSNMARSEFDPANAAVMVLNYCTRCDKGGGFEETTYYSSAGVEISPNKA
jgi:hypothetical protein